MAAVIQWNLPLPDFCSRTEINESLLTVEQFYKRIDDVVFYPVFVILNMKVDNKSGHRKRLRKRFLQSGLDGFLDYEIVELLLTLGTPRKDCKKMAKEAIKKFGSLKAVLDAEPTELRQIKGIGSNNAFGIKLFQALSEKYSKEQLTKKILLNSTDLVAKFLQQKIGRKNKEHFFLLILDTRGRLIKEVELSIGILNASLVHPREVFSEVIKNFGAQIILGHNHPSGDSTPSTDDIRITKNLKKAADLLGIKLLDHIIVDKNDFFSLKQAELF